MKTSGMQIRVMLTPLDLSAINSLSAREPPKDEEDGSEQSPRDRKDQGEGQDVGDEAHHVFQREIVIDQEWKEAFEKYCQDEDETEDGDRENEIKNQLSADVSVDRFHRCRLLVRFGSVASNGDGLAAFPRPRC